ncbi:MAG: threonine--tRNA ligase, partial [Armatimonadetes bacterium]|nr:threonine--tRNA ligase [Armatimonadota bacterium]
MAKYDLETLRHSTAHVMAHAVRNLRPEAKVAIGPAIEDGFYYDFGVTEPFTPEDLERFSEEMQKIIAANTPFVRKEVSRDEALEMFKDEPYKVELIREFPDGEVISVYEEDGFVDLCRGPHVASTGEVKAFKLLKTSGAYWRGDERNTMLQRIYGTAAGPGLVFWHPKGALVRKLMEDYWRNEHLANGYDLIFTPHIARQDLWKTSGHLDFFTENMYQPMDVDGSPYLIRPMNCPFHLLIYKSRVRSYREFPIRWAELGTVYRYERSGVLHGLMRVRGFTQDDAHILCTREQLDSETKR